jgi:hypothetical protein
VDSTISKKQAMVLGAIAAAVGVAGGAMTARYSDPSAAPIAGLQLAALSCQAASVRSEQATACIELARREQLALLRQAIPDYDQVRNPVIRWIYSDTRIPENWRNVYENVID